MEDFTSFEDETLLRLAMEGDSRAEDALARRYVRLVRICARPFFLAGGDSEDLTQEGMLGLLSAIREFDPKNGVPFRSYAELCIQRRIFSAIKSATRLKHFPLNNGVSLEDAFGDESRGTNAHVSIDFRRTPEEQVLARESANDFFQTFSQCLSVFEQKVLRLYLEGCSYRFIAEECGKEEKAIDNAVQRIRRKLAKNLHAGDYSES